MMGISTNWTFKTADPKAVIWARVVIGNVNLVSVAFDTKAYVSLAKNIAKYTNISNCWVCGQVNNFSSPLLGVAMSNWMEVNPYEMLNTSYQCKTGSASLELISFRMMLVNASVQYICCNTSGAWLGQFNKSRPR